MGMQRGKKPMNTTQHPVCKILYKWYRLLIAMIQLDFRIMFARTVYK